LIVGGWSAGGNLAAVVCQLARDVGALEIRGQLLLTPVTDLSTERPSYEENGDGYILTKALMQWFRDHYVEPGSRSDPRVSPLLGDLSGLPPAVVISAEFDPLRDEGAAYAQALAAAGVPVTHIKARGHTHTSLTMVDVVLSGAPVRSEIADAVRGLSRVEAAGAV
jgi:acetyl esterase/lipase